MPRTSPLFSLAGGAVAILFIVAMQALRPTPDRSAVLTPEISPPIVPPAPGASQPHAPEATRQPWGGPPVAALLPPPQTPLPPPVVAPPTLVIGPVTPDPPTAAPSPVAVGAMTAEESRLGPRVPPSVRRWEATIVRWADHHKLDPNLVAALMMTESDGDPNAVSPMGAVGLMQVVGGSADPEENIRQGAAILASQLKRFGDLRLALAAYNAGAGRVIEYGGVPPFTETRNHVFRVMTRYELYTLRS